MEIIKMSNKKNGKTIRVTNEVKQRLDQFIKQLETEAGAPMTYSLTISHLLKLAGID